MDHKFLNYSGLKHLLSTKIAKQISFKVDKNNGDISNTKVRSVDTISAKFPVPVAGESTKTFLGKVKKFIEDFNGTYLNANVSYYVSPTGSDTNTGTSTSPFKTIKYALSTIPRDLGGYTATIYLADGIYDETVDIRGFSGGTVDIRSLGSPEALNTVCKVRKITVFYCSAKINIFGLYMTQTDDIAIDTYGCSIMYIRHCQAIESATTSYAFNFTYSKVRIEGCKTQNHRIGLRSVFSEVSSQNWVDSSSIEYGIHVDTGSTVAKAGIQPSGGIRNEYISNGSVISDEYGGKVNRLQLNNNVITVTLKATGWTGSTAPYSQTVAVSGVTDDMEAMLLSALEFNATSAVADAYAIAFSYITRGAASIGNGNVTFKVFNKPVTDIKVGLKAI